MAKSSVLLSRRSSIPNPEFPSVLLTTLLVMMFILRYVLAFIVSAVSLHDILQFEFYFENVMLCTLLL